ncbi:MAG: ATP synthase F0 subunit C [Planctomycetota bacterium]
MANWIRTAVVCFTFLLMADSASAQEVDPPAAGGGFSMDLGKSLGMGIVVIGAALGIGRIGGQAVEGMSRQPEAANSIQTAMLIAAALVEGAAFAALIFITFLT